MENLIQEYIKLTKQEDDIAFRKSEIKERFATLLKGNPYQDEDIAITFRTVTSYTFPKETTLQAKSLKEQAKAVETFAVENGLATIKAITTSVVVTPAKK